METPLIMQENKTVDFFGEKAAKEDHGNGNGAGWGNTGGGPGNHNGGGYGNDPDPVSIDGQTAYLLGFALLTIIAIGVIHVFFKKILTI